MSPESPPNDIEVMSNKATETPLSAAQTLDVLRYALSLTDWCAPSLMLGFGKDPEQGQFVVTGLNTERNEVKRIGYCVQIRKRRGQYGSDMVFLRHADGSLTTHENQSFIGVNDEQEALARSVFVHLPEEEDYSEGFSCCDKIREVGFIVQDSASRPSPAQSMMMTLITEKPDGTKSTTVTAFI